MSHDSPNILTIPAWICPCCPQMCSCSCFASWLLVLPYLCVLTATHRAQGGLSGPPGMQVLSEEGFCQAACLKQRVMISSLCDSRTHECSQVLFGAVYTHMHQMVGEEEAWANTVARTGNCIAQVDGEPLAARKGCKNIITLTSIPQAVWASKGPGQAAS